MFKSKAVASFGLIMLMLISRSLLLNMAEERRSYHNTVVDKAGKSHSHAPKILGPFIVVPYVESIERKKNGKKYRQDVMRHRYLLPDMLHIQGAPNVNVHQSEAHQAKGYRGRIHFRGKFKPAVLSDLHRTNVSIRKPYFVVALSDIRGIQQISSLTANQTKIHFEPGTKVNKSLQGIHAPVLMTQLEKKPLDFDFTLTLSGSSHLSIVPLGRRSELTLQSNWPEPGFSGDFIPDSYKIDENGFHVHWTSSWFANNINAAFANDDKVINLAMFPAFITHFIESPDNYQLIDRAIKYSVFFIGLVFMALFLFEAMAELCVHPLHYVLMGTILIIFYLILLACVEHTGFTMAYIIASLSCCALVAVYFSVVLHTRLRGMMFSGCLLVLYALLYGLLRSQTHIFLLGTGLLFVIFSAVILLMLRLNWHKFSDIHGLMQHKDFYKKADG